MSDEEMLKVILTASGISLTELDFIKEGEYETAI
jgi:hypothetical protein